MALSSLGRCLGFGWAVRSQELVVQEREAEPRGERAGAIWQVVGLRLVPEVGARLVGGVGACARVSGEDVLLPVRGPVCAGTRVPEPHRARLCCAFCH